MKIKGIVLCLGFLILFTMAASDLALAEAPKEIVIGSTLALSGRFEGIVGEFDKLGNAWTDLVNERGGVYVRKYGKKLPIRFVAYDDAGKPENAGQFYEKMATDPNIAFFMGPFSDSISKAAITVAAKHKIPMVLVCANDRILFDTYNYWRVTQLGPAEWELKNLVQVYKAKGGIKTFAILTMDTPHSNAVTAGFKKSLQEAGFKVVYSEIAPPDTKNFTTVIARMKKANVDAVAVESRSVDFIIRFLKQMQREGFRPKEVIGGHITKHVIEALGPDAENITGLAYYYDGYTQDHRDFLEITRRAGFTWGEHMESGIRYWAYRTIQSAIEQAGTLNREKIMDSLWEMDIRIMKERMKHTATGYGTLTPYPCQVQGGKFVSMWPLEKAKSLHKWKNP